MSERRERDLPGKPGPPARRTLDRQRATERLNPIREAAESGAGGRIGAADAVVGDLHKQNPLAHRHAHGGAGRRRVLRDVRECLRAQEISRGFDLLRKTVDRDLEIDG